MEDFQILDYKPLSKGHKSLIIIAILRITHWQRC